MSSSNSLVRRLLLLTLATSLPACQPLPMQTPSRGVMIVPGELGSVTVAIRWPERQAWGVQGIPLAADEAIVTVEDAKGQSLVTRQFTRTPEADATPARLELPVGVDYRLSARMQGADGELMALGQSAPFAVRRNQATQVPVRLDPVIMTVAGTGVDSYAGEGVPALEAAIQNPSAVGADAEGNLYVAVRKNSASYGNAIRKVTPDGRITTVVGLPPESSETYVVGDGAPAGRTQLLAPSGLVVSPEGDLVITDEVYGSNPRINRILVIPARDGRRFGKEMRAGHSYTVYTSPQAIANVVLAPDQALYASVRNWIVRVEPDGAHATVAGIDGNTTGGAGEDGPATTSDLKIPDGLAVDALGNLLIADRSNYRVRMLCRSSGTYYGIPMQAGWIYTIAGLKASGAWQRTSALFPIVDGKKGLESSLNFPRGLVLDAHGYLYISDSSNNLIRRLSPDGTLVTVAGNGKPTKLGKETYPLGDGGSSLEATLCFPGGIAIGPRGSLYVADSSNNLVRRIRI